MTTTTFQTPSEFPGITYGGDDWRAARIVYRLHTILGRIPPTLCPSCGDCAGCGLTRNDGLCPTCNGRGWVTLDTNDVEAQLTSELVNFLHYIVNGDDSTVGGLLALLDLVHTLAANA